MYSHYLIVHEYKCVYVKLTANDVLQENIMFVGLTALCARGFLKYSWAVSWETPRWLDLTTQFTSNSRTKMPYYHEMK